MKRLSIIAMLLAGASLLAAPPTAEPADAAKPQPPRINPPRAKAPQPPHAWLGLQVSKPDETITAHLPALPPGIGFVVTSVDEGGPAHTAGLQKLDLLVKLGDQLLVNEGQLAALLRLSKPNDEVQLSGFRAGQPLKVNLKLGEAPPGSRPFPFDMVDAAILPGECGGPMRVINLAERQATYATAQGKVVVQRDGSIYQVTIRGPKDEPIYDGELPADGNLTAIPEDWRRRVLALRRGLDHALAGATPGRPAIRPRVVPPAERNP